MGTGGAQTWLRTQEKQLTLLYCLHEKQALLTISLGERNCSRGVSFATAWERGPRDILHLITQGHSFRAFECSGGAWEQGGCCSVHKSHPILWDPMDFSTWAFPVLCYLLEFAQTHVHWVGDAIQEGGDKLVPKYPGMIYPERAHSKGKGSSMVPEISLFTW